MGKSVEQANEQPARKVLDRVPSMLAYWDRDLRCRFANRAYERWFGVDPDSLVGTPIQDLLGPALFALNEPHIRAALRGEEQTFQRVVPGADGVQRQSLAHYLPDIVDGDVQGFVVQVTDVTPLKETEAALRVEITERERACELLRKSEAALQQAQRLGQIGSWSWEAGPDITSWSDQLYRIFGRDPKRLPPSYAEHGCLYTAQSWAVLQDAVARTLECGDPYILELEYVRPDGATGWIEARGGVAERDEHGAVVALHGTAQEITARHEARDAQRFLERIGALTPGVFYVFDVDRQCNVFINRSVALALGYTSEEIHAMGANVVPTLMHPDDRARFGEHLARVRALGNEETAEFEHRMRDRAGEWHWFQSRDAAFSRNAAGGVREVVGTAFEITQRKQTEEALRQSEEAHRQLFENAAVGMVCVEPARGRFLRANRRYCEMTGYSAAELAERSVGDITHPEDFASGRETLERFLSGELRSYTTEKRLIRKDGVALWVAAEAQMLFDGAGQPASSIWVVSDITERKAAEQALRMKKQQLESLLSGAPLGVAFFDRQHRYVQVNETLAAINGIPAAGHVGRTIEGLLPVTAASVGPVLDRIFDTGEVVANLELSGETPREPGVQRHWLAGFYPVRDAHGVALVGGWVIEITERKRAELSLRDSEHFTRRVLDNLYAFVGVMATDGTLLEANRAPLEAAGITPSDVLGQKFWDSYWWSYSPQLQAQVRGWCERAAAGEIIRCDVPVRTTGDGRMWIDFQLAPLRNGEGQITHLIPSAMDLSARRETEAALRASEEFSRTVLESSPDCVKVLDSEGRLQFMNANGRCLMEIDDFEQLRGQLWWNLWPPAEAPMVREAVEKARHGEAAHFQAFRPTAKGTPKWWDVIVAPVPDEPGDRGGRRLISVSRDVTARRAIEHTLRQNAELFSRLIEQAPTGMYVVDAEFRLTQVNALAAPVFGTIDPLIGRDLAEIMDILWGPEVGGQCTQIFRHTLATGERYVSPPFSEQRFDLGVEQAFEWEAQRVTLPDGRHGVVCYFHEITARQRAERALRESEEQVRMATEATGVGIWQWNVLTGRIKWDAQMFRIYGMSPTADGFVRYEDWSGSVLPEELPAQEALLQDTVRRLGNGSREFRIRRRDDGQCRTIQSVETVRASVRGQTEWVVGTNLDVSMRLQMEEELKEAARRKDEFLATLAHELRNPLAPVRNSLELMRRSGGNTAIVERARVTMERQVGQMVRLIDDLLDVSRITRGRLDLKQERIDLATIVNLAVEACQPHCELAGQELRVIVPTEPIHLHVDPARLAQVFGNLLNNASKYTPSGGRIWLTADVQGDEVAVSVRDTGIGIPPDMLPKVFDLFTQVDQSQERSKGGLGIGLALAKQLTEMHGGTLTARSDGPHRGSEFVVRLPIVTEARNPAGTAPVAEGSAPSTVRRILVVDDNRDAAESLAALLTLNGNQTELARDGLEAVEKAESFRPDVILLDIGLPKMNGYDACRRIRAQPWGVGVLILAQTGWGQEGDRRATQDAGFDGHLVKPVDPGVLFDLLASRRRDPT
jgi:PAS domain S-box-containing protein